MAQTHIVVYPAYGRVVETNKELRDLFFAGKDFSAFLTSGPYLSIRDFVDPQSGGYTLLQQYAGVILAQPRSRGHHLNVLVNREEMK